MFLFNIELSSLFILFVIFSRLKGIFKILSIHSRNFLYSEPEFSSDSNNSSFLIIIAFVLIGISDNSIFILSGIDLSFISFICNSVSSIFFFSSSVKLFCGFGIKLSSYSDKTFFVS